MIPFSKYTWVYRTISSIVIGVGLISIILWGFRPSIDFLGGSNMSYQFLKPVSESTIRKIISTQQVKIEEVRVQGTTVSIRTKAIDEKKEALIRTLLKKNAGSVTLLSFETVGPVIGAETLRKTGFASAIALIGILLYIAYAFKNLKFAISAIIALVHDVLVVVGMYSLISHFAGAELDSLFVTALLTTMSFSVHDTIVVFDQIRDYRRRYGEGDISQYADKALTDTMVRSFNNSMTIIFMLLALVLLGGSSIRFFAITLLIGTITGTYSSPFVATPVAVWMESKKH